MRKKKSLLYFIKRALLYAVLVAGAGVFVLPLYILLTTSVKVDAQIFVNPPVWIPNPVKWSNYADMFRYFKFFLYLKNTLIVVGLSLAGVVVVAPITAYAFSRVQWPGRTLFFYVMLGTMMLPTQVTMIPLYVLYTRVGWVDTFLPLWLPICLGGGAFNVFLVRQFLLTIPMEIQESAIIDGANHFTNYFRIVLPLVRPAVITVALFHFMAAWNDFLGPLIYLNDQNKATLSLGLRLFQQASGTTYYGMLFAATTMMILPVILFFFLGQKQFIEGVVLTGMKA